MGQAAQLLEAGMLQVPAGQTLQALWPAPLYVPAEQAVQPKDPAPLQVPAAQAVHTPSLLASPAKQGLGGGEVAHL